MKKRGFPSQPSARSRFLSQSAYPKPQPARCSHRGSAAYLCLAVSALPGIACARSDAPTFPRPSRGECTHTQEPAPSQHRESARNRRLENLRCVQACGSEGDSMVTQPSPHFADGGLESAALRLHTQRQGAARSRRIYRQERRIAGSGSFLELLRHRAARRQLL